MEHQQSEKHLNSRSFVGLEDESDNEELRSIHSLNNLFDRTSSIFANRNWTSDSFDKMDSYISTCLSKKTHQEIRQAIEFKNANGLTIDNITQEDFRLPSFAKKIIQLREKLDNGHGFAVIDTGLSKEISEENFEVVGWAICNYFGKIIRQGIDHDQRFFTVSDKGKANTDPTRIGASAKRSAKHSDNGCLEPRPPCYLALFCFQASNNGGENTIISAQTVFKTFAKERPDLLPHLFKTYHFRSPQAHVWPSMGPTIQKPILEFKQGELMIHYARVMIRPGMEMAGLLLSPDEEKALEFLDEVLERPELNFMTLLKPGQLLVMNNLAFLHGREAFTPGSQAGRSLKRYWMWRRHIGAGTDPALLDLVDLQQKD